MKILVVDDKEDARYLLTALLAGHGHTVVEAANGQEALAQLRADAFDLVVSDILMPVMDGFRLCHEVRKDDRLKSILFIFYTATYIQESDAAFARQIGADDFVLKPAEPEALLARIQAVVDKANARDWTPRAPGLIDEADVLRLYSERLVAKLEKRTLDLDRELGERQRAEAVARRQAERLAMLR
jgi:CheY-like chemotaxis protein